MKNIITATLAILSLALAIFLILVSCFGCIAYKPGEAKTVRVTNCGMKVKMCSESGDVSPIILYFGWTEVEFAHAYKADVEIDATHNDISLWKGSGTVKRKTVLKSLEGK